VQSFDKVFVSPIDQIVSHNGCTKHFRNLLTHAFDAVASAVTKVREHVEPLRTLNAQLAAIMKSHPGQYYR
jgi:hypothetical protein